MTDLWARFSAISATKALIYDGYENQIDLSDVAVSNNGIELIDREFIAAIREGRAPNGCVSDVLGAMQTLDKIEQSLS